MQGCSCRKKITNNGTNQSYWIYWFPFWRPITASVWFFLTHSNFPKMATLNSWMNDTLRVFFYPLIVTLNVVEHLWNMLAPVIICVIIAINNRSFTGLFFPPSLLVTKRKKRSLSCYRESSVLKTDSCGGKLTVTKTLTLETPSLNAEWVSLTRTKASPYQQLLIFF